MYIVYYRILTYGNRSFFFTLSLAEQAGLGPLNPYNFKIDTLNQHTRPARPRLANAATAAETKAALQRAH